MTTPPTQRSTRARPFNKKNQASPGPKRIQKCQTHQTLRTANSAPPIPTTSGSSTEYRSAYWLNPAEPESATPLDGYLAQEYARGYIVRSMVAVVNHPHQTAGRNRIRPKGGRESRPTWPQRQT